MSYRVIIMILSSMLVSLVAVRWIYFRLLKIAQEKDLVDHPEARKLQKTPVPVVGGLVVLSGLISGLLAGCVIANLWALELPIFSSDISLTNALLALSGMIVMLYAGFVDDVLGLSPKARFMVEILVILGLVGSTGVYVDSLHGLWGVEQLSMSVALPLTVFAGVGIINAVNMMDGVNGLSSGICISCSLLCGLHFVYTNDIGNALLAFCMTASLIFFFIHNVFGNTSRMFIGDAGTMLLGILMTWFVFSIMHDANFPYAAEHSICPTAMVVALFSVPVADTLRVMTMRAMNGRSPFSPDQTHLHHAFVSLGFSHFITTVSEILFGLIVVVAWYISVLLGTSLELQLYIVILVAAILVWGSYFFLVHEQKSNSRKAQWLRNLSVHTHLEDTKWWKCFSSYLGAPALPESE